MSGMFDIVCEEVILVIVIKHAQEGADDGKNS